jgi:hypothetical protein
MTQPDLFSATARRDAALKQASREPWMTTAFKLAVQVIPRGVPMIGEEIRNLLIRSGLEAPHHHNAWGALSMALVRERIIAPTGVWRKMNGAKSHARKSPEYVR